MDNIENIQFSSEEKSIFDNHETDTSIGELRDRLDTTFLNEEQKENIVNLADILDGMLLDNQERNEIINHAVNLISSKDLNETVKAIFFGIKDNSGPFPVVKEAIIKDKEELGNNILKEIEAGNQIMTAEELELETEKYYSDLEAKADETYNSNIDFSKEEIQIGNTQDIVLEEKYDTGDLEDNYTIEKQKEYKDQSKNKYYPIISSTIEGEIGTEVATEIISLISPETNIINAINLFFTTKSANDLYNLNNDNKDKLIKNTKRLDTVEGKQKNISDFYKNNQELVREIDNKENEKYQKILHKIATNYIPLEDKNGDILKEETLKASIYTTINSIIDGKNNHNKDKENEIIEKIYSLPIEDISSPKHNDIMKSLMDELIELDKLVNTGESVGLAKQSKEFTKGVEKLIKENQTKGEFADKIVKYIKDNTFEAETVNQKLIDIIEDLDKKSNEKISLAEQKEIISKVKEIIGEQ